VDIIAKLAVATMRYKIEKNNATATYFLKVKMSQDI